MPALVEGQVGFVAEHVVLLRQCGAPRKIVEGGAVVARHPQPRGTAYPRSRLRIGTDDVALIGLVRSHEDVPNLSTNEVGS